MIAPALVNRDGTWWPAIDTDAHGVITADCEPSIAKLLAHVPGRTCIVQAGANVGLYPITLAKHFAHVVTAEPDPTNWECLRLNLLEAGLDNITAIQGAFGEREGGCTPVPVSMSNCGAHRVNFTKGETPVWTIDSLELEACDAIWLDCEGSELFALKGAIETIQRHSPILAIEDKGLDHDFFDVPLGELQRWLAPLGYREIDRIGRDKIFRRET